jgi:5'-nucleotidase/UDP-sugar diphosphatase
VPAAAQRVNRTRLTALEPDGLAPPVSLKGVPVLRRLCLTTAVVLCACSSSSSPPPPPPAPRLLTLLHSNDEHSHLLGLSPEVDDFPAPTVAGTGSIKGGASRRSVVLAQERAAAADAGAATLTVSAGDNQVGTLAQVADTYPAAVFGSGDYRVLSMLKYDVTTLGNHEFDYGPNELARIISAAQGSADGIPAIVSSNIHFSGTQGDADLAALFDETGTDTTKPMHRWLVVTASNGLRVGFVGILGANAASVAPLKAPVVFSVPPGGSETDTAGVLTQIYADLQPVVDNVRSVGKADVVVALSHSNLVPGALTTSEDYLIAQNVSGIDVIVSGHTHSEVPAILVTNTASGKNVMVQQAGRYGDHIGRMSLSVNADGGVEFDSANSMLVPIDDTTIPSDTAINSFISGVISSIEQTPVALAPDGGPLSFLQFTLGEVFGAPQALPSEPGSLAFKSVAGLSYDIDNSRQVAETELADLVSDSILAAADAIAPTDLSVEAEGSLRVSTLAAGKTQELSFDDLFAAVSLGASPVNGTLGYPLCRFAIVLGELKATFEATLSLAYAGNTDFYLVPAGFKFVYDLSRPANARVIQIFMTSTHAGNTYDTYDAGSLLYDNSTSGSPGWIADPTSKITTTATLYVASFAAVEGVTLYDADTDAIVTDVTSTILHRADGSEIKEWEALGNYAYTQALANAGTMPARYSSSGTLPRRAICLQSGVPCP